MNTLFFIISILLATAFAWNLNMLLRLEDASKNMSSEVFSANCNFTVSYIRIGKIVSIVMLFVSLLLIFLSNLY